MVPEQCFAWPDAASSESLPVDAVSQGYPQHDEQALNFPGPRFPQSQLPQLQSQAGWPGADPTILLPYAPASVAGARRVLSTDLRERGISEEVISDAILVLSEMLSNALKHARPLPDSGRVRMGWTVTMHADNQLPAQTRPAGDGETPAGTPAKVGQAELAGPITPDPALGQVATVYLMVNDGGGTTRPRVLSVPQSATGGRGLGIVTSLADEWGVDDQSYPGITMWVRFYDGVPGSRSERALRRAHQHGYHPEAG